MNEIAYAQAVEKLETLFTNILHLRPEEMLCAPNTQHLTEIKSSLNDIFKEFGSYINCTDVIYTLNTDKEYFGLCINPVISSIDMMKILTTDDDIHLRNYQVEIDSKLLDLGLDADEITAMLLYEVSSTMSEGSINEVRSLIDLHVLADDDVIRIRDSANYSQLIIYAIKDTLYKASSLLFKEDVDDLLANEVIVTSKLDPSLVSAQDKLINNVYGSSDTVRSPKTVILAWMFMVYKNMKLYSRIAKETLEEAKLFTASILVKQEIDKTLASIERINAQTVLESTVKLTTFIEKKAMYSLNEVSIFKSLKTSGLRSIEDDYYELAVRAKAAETEDDVLFVLRGINTRLSILEDYLVNTDLSDNERKHWTKVANDYRALRDTVANSKVLKRKQYGLFYDYTQDLSESVLMEAKRVKIPNELKLTPDSFSNDQKFKKALSEVIKYMEDNNASEKQLSKQVYLMYYGIIGNTFANGVDGPRFGHQLTILVPYINKYCTDKQKDRIKKDMDKTINALNKLVDNGNKLTVLQKSYLEDLLNAAKKLK